MAAASCDSSILGAAVPVCVAIDPSAVLMADVEPYKIKRLLFILVLQRVEG